MLNWPCFLELHTEQVVTLPNGQIQPLPSHNLLSVYGLADFLLLSTPARRDVLGSESHYQLGQLALCRRWDPLQGRIWLWLSVPDKWDLSSFPCDQRAASDTLRRASEVHSCIARNLCLPFTGEELTLNSRGRSGRGGEKLSILKRTHCGNK